MLGTYNGEVVYFRDLTSEEEEQFMKGNIHILAGNLPLRYRCRNGCIEHLSDSCGVWASASYFDRVKHLVVSIIPVNKKSSRYVS